MNIVESSMGRPVIFSAIPPETAVEKLVQRASDRLRTMQEAKEHVIKELAMFKVQKHMPQADDAKYKIVQGRQQIYSLIAKMASGARKEILAYVEKEDLMKIYYTGVLEELEAARGERGVRVMILTDVDYSLAETINNYSGCAEIKHTRIPGMSILLVVDESELVVSAMASGSNNSKREDGGDSGDVALWMNGRNFVAGIKGLLRDNWDNAIDAATRIKIIREGGKALQDVLVVKGQQTIAEFYQGMVARAKSEILHISMPYDSSFFDVARKAAGGRVKVRALTSIDAGSLARVKELLRDPSCAVRHAGAGAGGGGGINVTLVDGEEVLLTPPAPSAQGKEEGEAAAAGQSAIWSSLHDYVEHYRSMFDSLWQSSAPAQERIAQVEGQARLAELASTLRRALKGYGFAVKDTLRGASGLVHSFALVAEGRGGGKTIVADIVGPEKGGSDDLQTLLIGFVIKCMDIKADHKVLITASDPGGMAAQARALHAGITVVAASDAAKTLARLAGTAAAPAAATTTG
jgi:sugar-specific transcriptional regulator TrmB